MPHSKLQPKTFCTTREAAELLSVSLRTAQLWVENGLLKAWKTDGGHRRITRQSVEELLASPKNPVAANETLPDKLAQKTSAVLNVLVVDDDAALRRLYEVNLRRWSMPLNIMSADDGYEALIRIGQTKPDLLIADLQMPGMDGFRMLYTLCSMPELAGMEIVVVSGLSPAEISNRGGLPAGIPVLPKPIPFPQLRSIAEQLLLKRQQVTR